jgi:hypothetical protein
VNSDASPLYRSLDNGSTWQTCGSSENYIALAASGTGAAVLAVPLFGVPFLSLDSGATWAATTLPKFTGGIQFPNTAFTQRWITAGCSSNGKRMMAIASYGAYVSTNGGTNWKSLTLPSSHEILDAVMSPDGAAIYMSTWAVDPRYGGSAKAGPLLKSTVSKGAFEDPAVIYATPLDTRVKLACGGAAGVFVVGIGDSLNGKYSIHISSTGGKSFNSADWSDARLVAVALSGDASRVYLSSSNAQCGLSSCIGTGAVYASYDKGKTFNRTGGDTMNCRDLASNADGSKLVAAASIDLIYFGESAGSALPTWSPLNF